MANNGSGWWMCTYKVFVTYDTVVGMEGYSKLGSVCINNKILCCLQKQHWGGGNLSEFITTVLVITVFSALIVQMHAMLQSNPHIVCRLLIHTSHTVQSAWWDFFLLFHRVVVLHIKTEDWHICCRQPQRTIFVFSFGIMSDKCVMVDDNTYARSKGDRRNKWMGSV